MKQLTLSGEAVSHDVCHGVDLGSGIHDVELLGVRVGLHDGLREKGIMPGTHTDTRAHTTHAYKYISFVFFTAFLSRSYQRLTAAGDGGMGDWMEPGEGLGGREASEP